MTRLTVAEQLGGSEAVAYVHLAGDEICLWPAPNQRGQLRCSNMEVSRGRLYLVDAGGEHRQQSERIEGQPG